MKRFLSMSVALVVTLVLGQVSSGPLQAATRHRPPKRPVRPTVVRHPSAPRPAPRPGLPGRPPAAPRVATVTPRPNPPAGRSPAAGRTLLTAPAASKITTVGLSGLARPSSTSAHGGTLSGFKDFGNGSGRPTSSISGAAPVRVTKTDLVTAGLTRLGPSPSGSENFSNAPPTPARVRPGLTASAAAQILSPPQDGRKPPPRPGVDGPSYASPSGKPPAGKPPTASPTSPGAATPPGGKTPPRPVHPFPPHPPNRPVDPNDGTGVWGPYGAGPGKDDPFTGPSRYPVDHSKPGLNNDNLATGDITPAGVTSGVDNTFDAANGDLTPGRRGGGPAGGPRGDGAAGSDPVIVEAEHPAKEE